MEVQADDVREDVGWWVEGAGRQGEEAVDFGVHLGGGGEQTVVADAGRGGYALGDFALHHQDGAGDLAGGGGFKEMEQDVRGDVVRQVADNIEGFTLRSQRSQVGREDVGFEDFDSGVFAEAEAQFGGKGAIEFDRDQALGARREDVGDGAVAGTDLDDSTLREVAQRVGDPVARVLIDKKILTKLWLS